MSSKQINDFFLFFSDFQVQIRTTEVTSSTDYNATATRAWAAKVSIGVRDILALYRN